MKTERIIHSSMTEPGTIEIHGLTPFECPRWSTTHILGHIVDNGELQEPGIYRVDPWDQWEVDRSNELNQPYLDATRKGRIWYWLGHHRWTRLLRWAVRYRPWEPEQSVICTSQIITDVGDATGVTVKGCQGATIMGMQIHRAHTGIMVES